MANQPASSSSSGDRFASRADVAVAVTFIVGTLGYVAAYLLTDLPEFRSDVNRAQVLGYRLLLPEQAVGRWFGEGPWFAAFDRLPILALAAGIIGCGWMIGDLVLGAWFRPDEAATDAGQRVIGWTKLERFIFSCGVGLNLLSLYVLAAGLAGSLTRWTFVIPAVAVGGLSLAKLWRRPSNQPVQRGAGSADDVIAGRWLWLAIPFIAVIVLGGMLPPSDFDVREYHLEAPKEFFLNGSIGFLPHNVYGNMPLGSEMFSLLGMVLVNDWWFGALIGKTVIAAFAPLTALALIAAGRRFASPGAGIVAAILYLSIPWISIVSTSGLIEGVVAFYLVLSVYAVLLWREQLPAEVDGANSNGGLFPVLLAGFCSGAAVACKYPAVLFVALPLAIYIAVACPRRALPSLALFSLALLAGCGLWLAKNWFLTGNPVYPLLYEWFGGETRTPENNARWLSAHLPHQFTIAALFGSLAKVLLTSSWLSPVLIPLAAMGLLVKRYRRLTIFLAGYFAYVVAAWWLCTHRIDRFWIPALPLLALLAGVGAVWSTTLAWQRTVLAMLVAGMSIGLLFNTAEPSYNAYFVSLAEARHDLNRINEWHERLNEHVPPGCTVLSVGDAQVFDLAIPVLYNTAFDPSVFAKLCEGRKSGEIAAEFSRRGISHVYVHWAEIYRYRQPGNYGGVPEFVRQEWFAELVRQGVLGHPWSHPFLPYQEVYPVPAVCNAARRQAQPPVTTVRVENIH